MVQRLERNHTYLKSQRRLNIRSQELHDSSSAFSVTLSEQLSSMLGDSSDGGELDGWLP